MVREEERLRSELKAKEREVARAEEKALSLEDSVRRQEEELRRVRGEMGVLEARVHDEQN